MVWPLLEVIDARLDEPWCRTLATHLGHFDAGEERELRRGRRYAVARRLAGLFASYARQRPQLLVDWRQPATPADLDDDLHWQPELWRALVARVDADPPHIRHAQDRRAAARVAQPICPPGCRCSGTPGCRAPTSSCSRRCPPTTTCTCGCRTPATRCGERSPASTARSPGATTPATATVAHPLLATLGRDLRELQRGLPAIRVTDEYLAGDDRARHPARLAAVRHRRQCRSAAGPDARDGRPLGAGAQLPRSGPAGRRAARGAARPARRRPDARAARHPGDVPGHRDLCAADRRRLRPRRRGARRAPGAPAAGAAGRPLADPDQPAAGAWPSQLLALAGGRVTASEVLNLAQAAPVRARFGFTDDDLEAITRWVRQANIRWGFDQRASRALRRRLRPQHMAFRHRPGAGRRRDVRRLARLDRHHAAARRRQQQPRRTGRPARRVRRSAATRRRLARRHQAAGATGSTRSTDGIDAADPGQRRRRLADRPAAARVRRRAAPTPARGPTPRCGCPTSARCSTGHLAGRPTRANFRTGTLTVCTMVPMRSVPHRVVCLVGLDDGRVPAARRRRRRRRAGPRPDDRRTRHPFRGPAIAARRDRRGHRETGDHLHRRQRILRAGSARLRCRSPSCSTPSTAPPGARCATAIVVEHPLQPFDIRNVMPGRAGRRRAVHASTRPCCARREAAARRTQPNGRRSSPARCRHRRPTTSSLADLSAFFKDPVKGFFRALDFTLPWDVDGVEDAMPVDIDAPRGVGGRRPDARRHAARHDSGRGAAGRVAARHAAARAAGLAQGQRDPRPGRPVGARRALAVPQRPTRDARTTSTSTSAAGRRLTGTVSPVYGDRLVSVTYSQARRQAPAASRGFRCWRCSLTIPAGTGRRSASAGRSGAPRREWRRLGRPDGRPPSRCSPIWWRSTTRAVASRCRCRSRRRTPGPSRAARRRATRNGRRGTGGSPATTPARTGAGARAGVGQGAPLTF